MFDEWYDSLLGSSTKYDVTNFTLGPTVDRPFGLACEVIVSKDRESREEGIILAKALLGYGDILVDHVKCDYSSEEIIEEVVRLNTEDNLCPLWYADRGASTSGFNTPLTMKILQKSKIFGELVEKIVRTRNGNPASIWVSANVKGSHRWHQDGFRNGVNYRNLLTIGGENKIMWFRCQESEGLFGLRVPHGCLITLSRYAAGVGDSTIEHHITGGKNSWLLAFETA